MNNLEKALRDLRLRAAILEDAEARIKTFHFNSYDDLLAVADELTESEKRLVSLHLRKYGSYTLKRDETNFYN